MTSEIQIVPATEAHALALAPAMRAADVAELTAMGQQPLEVLRLGLERSEGAWSAMVGEDVAAMFGVDRVQLGGMLSGREIFTLWFLTGATFARYPIALVKVARRFLSQMLERWPVLCNIVDGRYTGAMQLLALLGAEFFAPVDVGGLPFLPFVLRRRTT